MKIFVLIGHQRVGSLCHSIANAAIDELKASGHEIVFHDLYAERFDPILYDEEIPRGAELPPIIKQHCDEVTSADGFIIVHPNWWAMPPAMLKGWLDRVFRQGMTYRFGPSGVEGLLKGKTAVVFTTSNTPRADELRLYGDPLENLWKNCIFGMCGLADFTRCNFESIVMSTPQQRQAWLEETRTLVKSKFTK
jgi:putative NADPH-quinone reductase